MKGHGSVLKNAVETQAAIGNVVYLGDDEFIANGIAAGNGEALEALFNKYAPFVRIILAQTLGPNESELDDRTQEVFIAAFSSAHRIKERRDLKSWLYSIAVHKAIDSIRRRKRRRWLHYVAPDVLPDVAYDGEDIEMMSLLHVAFKVIEKMPVKERIPFTLRRLEGMKIAEIAKICNVSVPTINRRLNSGSSRFEKYAANYPELQEWLASLDKRRNV